MKVWKEVIPHRRATTTSTKPQGLRRCLMRRRNGFSIGTTQGKEMIKAELSIPIPLEHQLDAKPQTPAEKVLRKTFLNNSGEVEDFKIKDGGLYALHDIKDEAVAKKIADKTIKFVSPWINSFTGTATASSGTTLSPTPALTTRPQNPHARKPRLRTCRRCALSLVGNMTKGGGAEERHSPLSAAGSSQERGRQTQARRITMAFSLYSGIKLSGEEIAKAMPKKEEKKPEMKMEKPGDKPGEKPPMKEGETPPEGEMPLEGMEGMEESMVDADGDISVWEVICDLLASEGYDFPEGTTGDNFAERCYTLLMDKLKSKGQEMPLEPPPEVKPDATKPAGPKVPPIMQETAPMYMSLEQINAIPDATMKSIALSMWNQNESNRKKLAALEANSINGALQRRQARIEKLAKFLPVAQRDQLLAMANGAKLSMGDDGAVSDPLGATLDILEAGVRAMPSLLTTHSSELSVQDHPRDFGPEIPMSETRRTEVVAEFSRNGNIPAKKSA